MNEVVRSRRAVFYTVLDGVMSTAVLLVAIFVITGYLKGDLQDFYFPILFLCVAAQKSSQALLRHEKKEKKVVRLFISAGIYLISAGLYFILSGSVGAMKFIMAFLCADLIIGRVFAAIGSKRWRARIPNILIIMIWLDCAVYCIFIDSVDDLAIFVLVMLGYICLQSLFHIIAMSFSQIKLNILMKIIRRTYALEILFGLGMLIISFSYVLQYFDRETFHSFGDGLWYCFAVVTTIGFGDLVATSLAGRILSVILGVYGIIVVSLITSIIINFYSEVKNDSEEKDKEETGKEKTDVKRLNAEITKTEQFDEERGEESEEQKIDAEIRELRQKLELLTEKKKEIQGEDSRHG